ncbi:MAG TPA: hypothetical protein VGY66_08625 [Gemmataceae bacterium]|nr:hypothetical protein [Gemmataceae bacterium]
MIARDAFVHHFGGRTFAGSGVDFAGVMRRNQDLFEKKWRQVSNLPGEVGVERAEGRGRPSVEPVARSGDRATAQRATALVGRIGNPSYEVPVLSLTMIVRDNEQTLRRRWRASGRGWMR